MSGSCCRAGETRMSHPQAGIARNRDKTIHVPVALTLLYRNRSGEHTDQRAGRGGEKKETDKREEMP